MGCNNPKLLADVPVRKVKISKIVITARLREVNAEKVDEIATSVSREGLLYPIVVWGSPKGLVLIAGRHRLEAFRKLGRTTIQAKVVNCRSEDEARLIEIDDNLCRSDLDVLEKAIQLRIREELLFQKGIRATLTDSRNSSGKVTTQQIADAVHMSTRSWQMYVQIAKGIPPELCNSILGTPLANHVTGLIELSRVSDKAAQKSAAMRIIQMESPSAFSVARAIKEEMRKRGQDYRPIGSRTHRSRYAERQLILRVAKVVAEAESKLSSSMPRASKGLKTAKDMLDKIRMILEFGGVNISSPDDFSSHFIRERKFGSSYKLGASPDRRDHPVKGSRHLEKNS